MKLHYQSYLKPLAQNLRKNMTDAEQKLWHKIRRKQLHDVQFFRQRPIEQYIVDFYCPTKKLIIEIDGGQHFATDGMHADRERDTILSKFGMTILRFDNREVLTNIDGVLEKILENL